MKVVYFVCYGNICRSPFAERYATLRAEQTGLQGVGFDSAGIGASPGTRCPKPGIRAAQRFSVDLRPHRAKPTSELAPAPDDLLIAMDRFVFGALADNLGSTLEQVTGPGGADLRLMMSWLADTELGSHDLDVPDPIGTGVEQYTKTYRLLSVAVDSLLLELSRK